MTVLGDFNQAIFAHASETVNFDTLTNLYGPDETNGINLTRSYRSTKPIIEFTRALVPEGKNIHAFERDGEKPTVTKVSNVNELHERITAKVAELQKSGTIRSQLYVNLRLKAQRIQALNHIDNIKLVKSNSAEYEQGIVVIPAYLAKGIEFDAVIIYNASKDVYSDESVRRLFYTACTRAMHELQLYSVGEVSPLYLELIRSFELIMKTP